MLEYEYMKVYTKTGDKGQTSLIGGERTDKDDPRIEAYGTVDELNAALGLAIAYLPEVFFDDVKTELIEIQKELFSIGSELASISEKTSRGITITPIGSEAITKLEKLIDLYDNELPALRNFILPGGRIPTSALHLARTICRRAERATITLTDNYEVNPELIKYLNRLSDLLFTVARLTNARLDIPDQIWQGPQTHG
jgi:cob(I)alamin adenosyltransferase